MNVEIITILDRSGSMSSLSSDVVGGYNTFLCGQKDLPGHARATLVAFNNRVECLYEGVPVQHLGNLTLNSYVTEGSTALYDAIGQTLNTQRLRIAEQHWASKVLVNIITDGADNTSREFTREQAAKLIAECENKLGWTFLYQAANLDAFKAGAALGISGQSLRSYQPTGAGMAEAYGTMSTVATTIRTGG
jgi:hypothetical protein